MSEIFTVELTEDGDELFLPFPPELLEKLGWKEGDKLLWSVDDEIVSLKKVN